MTIQRIKSYYHLTKPGIIYGNLLATAAGFLFASGLNINFILFISTILGTALVIASSCVINNYIDRDIDSKMKRTKNRAFVTGKISKSNGLTFAAILGVIGFGILVLFTNWLVVLAGAIGMSFYLIFYSIEKRRSSLGTLVGTIPGAMPPVAGYIAVTNQIDIAALLLFVIWVFWQLAHFYAIGIYRLKDYSEAKLPILPVKRGVELTKKHITVFIILFIVSVSLLTYYQYTGIIFLICILILGVRWLILAIQGFKTHDNVIWGKKVFGFSLVVMMGMCILLSLNVVLP